MFYKVTFCRDFLDFFALALVAFTHISKVPSHRENFHNARSALQKNLARLAANQSAYYCSHIITADINIPLNVWTEESDIPLRPPRDHPSCHKSERLRGLMIYFFFQETEI